MPGVLTTASDVTCGHPGSVSVQSSAKLTVQGGAVLLTTSIEGKTIGDCATVAKSDASGPTDKPCTSVMSVTAGEAGKLTAGAQPVMLDTLAGTTDGMVAKTTPQTLLSASALQAKLTAI